MTFYFLLLLSLYTCRVSSLRVVVAGYNTRLGIYDLTGEEISPAGEWHVDKDMTWLQLDGDYIWAGHEVGEYEGEAGSVVSRWTLLGGGAAGIGRLESVNTGSVYTAHLQVDKSQGAAYAANYGGSTLSVISLTDLGGLGELEKVESYGDCRDASHPHQTLTSGDFVWVVDLGCDTIRHYKTGGEAGLTPVGETPVRAGAGPRHAVIHPTRDLMFLLCELESYLQVYRYDRTSGQLDLLQELELSSTPGDAGAEILVGSTGQFVYASSRGSGVVVVYRIEFDDSLVRVQEHKLSGTWPRSFAIRDNVMVVVDQHGDSLEVIKVDNESGLLSSTGTVVATPPQPSFVGFMD